MIKEVFMVSKAIKFSRSFSLSHNILKLENLDELYENTMLHSGILRPQSFVNGKYKFLEAREKFVKGFLKDKKCFDYSETDYFLSLKKQSKELKTKKYEGNLVWSYTDPFLMAERYMYLIECMEKEKDHALLDPNEVTSYTKRLMEFSKEIDLLFPRTVYNKKLARYQHKKPESGFFFRNAQKYLNYLLDRNLINTFSHDNKIFVGNGCHRLAIYKVLSDMNKRSKVLLIRKPVLI